MTAPTSKRSKRSKRGPHERSDMRDGPAGRDRMIKAHDQQSRTRQPLLVAEQIANGLMIAFVFAVEID